MSKLLELVQERLRSKGLTAKALAERTNISYPTVLAVINEGRVPRKPEHREALRKALDVDTAVWTSAMAASQRGGGVDIASAGPQSLQQLIVRWLLETGKTEQTFANESAIAYATLMGITRKGSVPRSDTLDRLAEALGVTRQVIDAAVQITRSGTQVIAPVAVAAAVVAPADDVREAAGRGLAELAAAAVERSGLSVAAFAEERGLPYITLSRLTNQGLVPDEDEMRRRIASAIGLDSDGLHAAMNPAAADNEDHVASIATARVPAAQIALERASTNPVSDDIQRLIGRLSTESRSALLAFLKTVVR